MAPTEMGSREATLFHLQIKFCTPRFDGGGNVLSRWRHGSHSGDTDPKRQRGNIIKKPRIRMADTSQPTEAISSVPLLIHRSLLTSWIVSHDFRVSVQGTHIIPALSSASPHGNISLHDPFGHNFVSACEQSWESCATLS